MSRYEKGRVGVLWTATGNLVLAVAKLVVGIVARSDALLADGVHSLADLLSTFAVWIGLHVSGLPADAEHRYGHEKAEAVAQTMVAIFLILAGFQILYSSVSSLLSGRHSPPGWIAFWVALFSLVVKEILYRNSASVARRIDSKALMAAASDNRVDVWSSLAAAIGVLGARLGVPIMDPLAGAAVSLLVIFVGVRMAIGAIDDLMDKFTDFELLRAIEQEAEQVGGVARVEGIRARSMGPNVLVDLEIAVSARLSVHDGHSIARHVKEVLQAEWPALTGVHVHVNPDDSEGTSEKAGE